LLAIGLLAVVPGCSLFDSGIAPMFNKEPEFLSPQQLIPLWSDTVLHSAGNRGVRGCGGRFMFYTPDSKEAVRVDGTLTVYVWNDSAPSKDRKPDRKYVFRAEDLQGHYSKSKVGHSYSFWLPWDEAGGDRAELTVVARFVGKGGADILTPASKVILPGRIPMPVADNQDSEEDSNPADEGIQTVAWSQPDVPQQQPPPKSAMRTSEIPLTAGFVDRNQRLPEGTVLTAKDLFTNPPASSTPVDELNEVSSPPQLNTVIAAELPNSTSSETASDRVPPLASIHAASASTTIPEEQEPAAARFLRLRYQAQRERLAQRAAAAQNFGPSPAGER